MVDACVNAERFAIRPTGVHEEKRPAEADRLPYPGGRNLDYWTRAVAPTRTLTCFGFSLVPSACFTVTM